MQLHRLPLTETLESLPPEWPHDPLPGIQEAIQKSGRKVVVLDDDPTGTQTVHDVPVLVSWDVDILAEELSNDLTTFYILTNTRSMPLAQAQSLHAEIGRNLVEAARKAGKDYVAASRSDSTLRGHFPGEVAALDDALDKDFDGWIFAPFFMEGGRYTINDVHYVAEGEWLTPAGQTEFAQDSAFPFKASNIKEWVGEKTDGRVSSDSVISITLGDVRSGGPEVVTQKLMSLSNGAICFPNAVTMRDIEVFVQGLLEAEKQGKHFLYRTAASFLRARFGQAGHPLLTGEEMTSDGASGGLIIVGSHVPRTTSQLNHLLEQSGISSVEVNVSQLLSDNGRSTEISRVAGEVNTNLNGGRDTVIFTSRDVVTGDSAESSLNISSRVSQGIVGIMRSIEAKPRYLIAKGGITSSDVATEALGVKRAWARGQALPGVPVWELGAETRFPGLSYVIFPGNVGGPEALSELVSKLR